jgi:hypothetical protein
MKHSKETKEKMSIAAKKINGKNRIGKKHSEEAKRKMSESHLKMSDHTKQLIREKALGRLHSSETKLKISESMSGDKHPFYGKKHSEETKRKNRKSNKRVVMCPHCQLKGTVAIMHR